MVCWGGCLTLSVSKATTEMNVYGGTLMLHTSLLPYLDNNTNSGVGSSHVSSAHAIAAVCLFSLSLSLSLSLSFPSLNHNRPLSIKPRNT